MIFTSEGLFCLIYLKKLIICLHYLFILFCLLLLYCFSCFCLCNLFLIWWNFSNDDEQSTKDKPNKTRRAAQNKISLGDEIFAIFSIKRQIHFFMYNPDLFIIGNSNTRIVGETLWIVNIVPKSLNWYSYLNVHPESRSTAISTAKVK